MGSFYLKVLGGWCGYSKIGGGGVEKIENEGGGFGISVLIQIILMSKKNRLIREVGKS